MADYMELDKSTTVHLTVKGEMCNRLARGTRIVPVSRKGDWIKISWRKGKKKAGFFFRILVIKAPEFHYTSALCFFWCVMIDTTVENMDDEELLMYYQATQKLFDSKIKDEGLQDGKVRVIQKKLEYLEDELRARSLWESQ